MDLELTAQLERAKVVQAKTSGRRGRMAGARRLRPGLPPAAPLLLRRSSPPTPARFRPSQTLLRLRRQRKNNTKGRGVGTGGLSWRFGAGTPAGPSRSRGATGEAVRHASPPAARAQALRGEAVRHAAPVAARVPRANGRSDRRWLASGDFSRTRVARRSSVRPQRSPPRVDSIKSILCGALG